MRGRTALYGKRHVAQVVAIKRLQTMGRSLSEIQQLWPTLDDLTLARMSGVELPVTVRPARAEFWKREPRPSDGGVPEVPEVADAKAVASAAGPVAGEIPEGPASSDPAALPRARIVRIGPPGAPARVGGMTDAMTDASTGMPGAPERPDASTGMPGASMEPEASGMPAGSRGRKPVPVPGAAVELRIELAPHVVLSLSVTDESVVISPADVRALRAAAAPLLAELASRRLASHAPGEES